MVPKIEGRRQRALNIAAFVLAPCRLALTYIYVERATASRLATCTQANR